MGLMDKLKNMFTEEVEEDTKPIKKDVIQVEIPAARKEVRHVEIEETVSRVEQPAIVPVEPPKKEEKFVFPVYFDDKDFDELQRAKEKPKAPAVLPKEPYKAAKQQPIKEEKKEFKPSPVISPVYGILDKNYSKDSIVTKKRSNGELRSYRTATPSIEDVRKKAFGRLEDDLENTLAFDKKQSFFLSEDDEIKQEIDIIDELDLNPDPSVDDQIIDEMIDSREAIHANNYRNTTDNTSDDNMIEDELNKLDLDDDKLVESDLFNLIDSMYRGKEE